MVFVELPEGLPTSKFRVDFKSELSVDRRIVKLVEESINWIE